MTSLIVAAAENGAIGKDNQLLWHLPDDLRLFKRLTTGHAIVMGRKTYESIGRPLPNRESVILTRQTGYEVPGATVVATLEEALAGREDVLVIGGAEIYRLALPVADRIYLTEVHTRIDGDAFFETPAGWKEVSREHHPADEKHVYSFDFVVLDRQ
ncbi:MAG: dihydrofolate reductase [Siphonobacter aquaeclarae]|nr:dihydrofolate reductase [Siphonobacter aquaeclarae]